MGRKNSSMNQTAISWNDMYANGLKYSLVIPEIISEGMLNEGMLKMNGTVIASIKSIKANWTTSVLITAFIPPIATGATIIKATIHIAIHSGIGMNTDSNFPPAIMDAGIRTWIASSIELAFTSFLS